jgi:hypothetical protein
LTLLSKKLITSAKEKNIKAIKALLELTYAKFDKERNVKGLQEQIDKLAVGDNTKFLFDTVQQKEQQTLKGFGFQSETSVQQKPGT